MPAFVAFLIVFLFAAPVYALDATCGMTVPDGETVVLQADLACEGLPIAVTLGRQSTLDLNGFTLIAGEDMVGIYCAESACTVLSSAAAPGVIDGEDVGYYGLVSNLQPGGLAPIRKLVVDNVVIRDFESAGMYAAFRGKSRLSRLSVSGCGGPGIIGQKMVLDDLTVTGNGLDPLQSGDGIAASHVSGANVTATGNADSGLSVRGPVKLTGLTATGNGAFGVDVQALSLKDSQLSANGSADIQSIRKPRLKSTSCDHSNWSVCALD